MDLINRLPKIIGKYRFNVDLSKMCWFGVGGAAAILFQPKNQEDLVNFLKYKPEDIACYIFGIGSNLLISDKGVNGVVIRLGREFNYIKINENNNLVVGASCMDINVAEFAQVHGLGGLEFLSGIPGTIGGAIAMNAGAFSKEMKDIIVKVKAVDFYGNEQDFTVEELGYVYRGHSLKGRWIFTEAEIKTYHDEPDIIKKRIQEIHVSRLETQPIRSKTCGSTFTNPPGMKAWQLIEKAGCRGLSVGGAHVSEKHCNFLINTGNATAKDIEQLICEVKKRVFEVSGVELKEEVIFVGAV